MGSVFVSYSRADRSLVERLVKALEASGCTVWWDSALEGGQQFADQISAQIEKADAVVTVWSADSIRSRWVQAEALEAFGSQKLIGILLSPSKPGVPFNATHLIDFSSWSGVQSGGCWSDLLRSLDSLMSRGPASEVQAQAFDLLHVHRDLTRVVEQSRGLVRAVNDLKPQAKQRELTARNAIRQAKAMFAGGKHGVLKEGGEEWVGELVQRTGRGWGCLTKTVKESWGTKRIERYGWFNSSGMQGVGVIYWNGRLIWHADFVDSAATGLGEFSNWNDSSYSGMHKAGWRDGVGTYTDEKGLRYEGEFQKGEYYGLGVLWSKDGLPLKAGDWAHGALIREIK